MSDQSNPRIRTFRPADANAVIALWEASGLTKPWNDPRKDIDRKLSVQPELFVVAVDAADRIVGVVMGGYDGHRGWMNYLASDPSLRGVGIGRMLIDHIEAELVKLGCPKVNLQVRASNPQVVSYYEHLGYRIDDTIDLGKRLIED